jgi:hypothetical protein
LVLYRGEPSFEAVDNLWLYHSSALPCLGATLNPCSHVAECCRQILSQHTRQWNERIVSTLDTGQSC